MPTDDDFDSLPSVALSRSGVANPTGKLDQPMKTHVDIDTEAAFKRMCSEAGMTTSQAMRDWVFKRVHGKTFSEMQVDAEKVKRDRFFNEGPELVQNRTKQ
jgi:hypothetical protein